MIIRIQGPFEIQNGIYYEYDNESQLLGEGGMGKVYEGRCFRAGNPNEFIPVAIKKITASAPDIIERARREASVQIDHPNLLRMWGFIPNKEVDPASGVIRTQYYVVMDRLVGVDLCSLMNGVTIDRSGYNVPYAQQLYGQYVNDRPRFVKTVISSLFDAIDALHSSGYIHRDIDPSNVMVTDDNEIKLIDFGVCKPMSSNNVMAPKLTQTGSVIGKVDYAAPELLTGDVDHQNFTTDIYSLGVLLYQLYTGALPFSGTDAEIMQDQIRRPLPLKNVDDKGLRKVIEKATQKQQKSRYQSVYEMRSDFDACFVGKHFPEPTHEPTPNSPKDIPTSEPTETTPQQGVTLVENQEDSNPHTTDNNVPKTGPKPWVWILIIVLSLCLGVALSLIPTSFNVHI